MGGAFIRIIDDAEDHDGQNGADGRERNETEAVVCRMAVAADGRDADAERHDERHGHGAGRHAAGIERDGEKFRRDKERQKKHDGVASDKQRRQRDGKQHAQKRHDEEHADTACDG